MLLEDIENRWVMWRSSKTGIDHVGIIDAVYGITSTISIPSSMHVVVLTPGVVGRRHLTIYPYEVTHIGPRFGGKMIRRAMKKMKWKDTRMVKGTTPKDLSLFA